MPNQGGHSAQTTNVVDRIESLEYPYCDVTIYAAADVEKNVVGDDGCWINYNPHVGGPEELRALYEKVYEIRRRNLELDSDRYSHPKP